MIQRETTRALVGVALIFNSLIACAGTEMVCSGVLKRKMIESKKVGSAGSGSGSGSGSGRLLCWLLQVWRKLGGLRCRRRRRWGVGEDLKAERKPRGDDCFNYVLEISGLKDLNAQMRKEIAEWLKLKAGGISLFTYRVWCQSWSSSYHL